VRASNLAFLIALHDASWSRAFLCGLAIAAMDEIGIDLTGHRSKSVDEFAGQEFDYVITVCDNAKESCPVFPSKTHRIHWSFEDPAEAEGSDEEVLAVFTRVRDEIRKRLQEFIQSTREQVG